MSVAWTSCTGRTWRAAPEGACASPRNDSGSRSARPPIACAGKPAVWSTSRPSSRFDASICWLDRTSLCTSGANPMAGSCDIRHPGCGRCGVERLRRELDAQHLAAPPNDFAHLSFVDALEKSEFEAIRNCRACLNDNLRAFWRNIQNLTFLVSAAA